ncbi:basigin [Hemicordylus capensis]|uniref:basigin n=1 Tax=Hemicordylus capensis TaxID=884348 RepID=UPI002304549E|nr:basigin [Hemicordylus capensis]
MVVNSRRQAEKAEGGQKNYGSREGSAASLSSPPAGQKEMAQPTRWKKAASSFRGANYVSGRGRGPAQREARAEKAGLRGEHFGLPASPNERRGAGCVLERAPPEGSDWLAPQLRNGPRSARGAERAGRRRVERRGDIMGAGCAAAVLGGLLLVLCACRGASGAVRPVAGFIKSPLSQKTLTEDSVDLHCEAIGSPIPEIQWWFEGAEPNETATQLWDGAWQDRVKINATYKQHSTSTISIANLTLNDSGTYECRASNDPDRNHLSKSPKVKWIRSQANVIVIEREWPPAGAGSPAPASKCLGPCHAFAPPPPSPVSCDFPETHLHLPAPTIIPSFASPPSPHYEKLAPKCSFMGTGAKISATPEVTSGTNVIISCNITEPPTAIKGHYWMKGGVKLEANESAPDFTWYTIPKVDHETSGEYDCIFDTTPLSKATVLVKVVPHVYAYKKSEHGNEGDMAILVCRCNSYPPVTQWTWYKMVGDVAQPIINGSDRYFIKQEGNRTELRISSLDMEKDPGEYRCNGTNEMGDSSALVGLRVRSRLAALWPFLGIVAEVLVLVTIIFIYEKKRKPDEVAEDDDGGSAPLKSNATNHKNVRQRNAN